MCRGCERVRSSSSRIGERKDSPDPHERTAAILLAEALRTHGNILALPSSAEGLRLHPRPYGEGCALSAGTPRRLRKAKQLPSRGRTEIVSTREFIETARECLGESFRSEEFRL